MPVNAISTQSVANLRPQAMLFSTESHGPPGQPMDNTKFVVNGVFFCSRGERTYSQACHVDYWNEPLGVRNNQARKGRKTHQLKQAAAL